MAGRNRKTSAIKDIDEMESVKEEPKVIEEPVEENIKIESKPKDDIPTVHLRKVKVDPWLNVRNKPSMSGSEIIGKLVTDDVVEIFATRDGFAKISETEEKWVSMDYLVPVYS